MNIILIETIDEQGTAWGVGLNSPNPTLDNYIEFAGYDDAAKCKKLLDKLLAQKNNNDQAHSSAEE